jgi:hypothetical protein
VIESRVDDKASEEQEEVFKGNEEKALKSKAEKRRSGKEDNHAKDNGYIKDLDAIVHGEKEQETAQDEEADQDKQVDKQSQDEEEDEGVGGLHSAV